VIGPAFSPESLAQPVQPLACRTGLKDEGLTWLDPTKAQHGLGVAHASRCAGRALGAIATRGAALVVQLPMTRQAARGGYLHGEGIGASRVIRRARRWSRELTVEEGHRQGGGTQLGRLCSSAVVTSQWPTVDQGDSYSAERTNGR
jgi:hypothetical protein